MRLELGAAQHLDVDHGDAPQQRREEHQQRAGVDHLQTGPQDDERADKADKNRRPAAPAEHLAQEQRAEQRREQRCGEGERGRPRYRGHRQADEEAHHRHRIDDGAQQVQAELLRMKQARPVAHEQRGDHHQTEQVAKEGDLEARQVLGGIADGGVHGGEQQRAEHHQQTALRHRRQPPVPVGQRVGENQEGELLHAGKRPTCFPAAQQHRVARSGPATIAPNCVGHLLLVGARLGHDPGCEDRGFGQTRRVLGVQYAIGILALHKAEWCHESALVEVLLYERIGADGGA